MGEMVIVAYRPYAGKEGELLDLIKEHVPILRSEGLATEREPIVMRAESGAFIEIFEWASAEAIEAAHSNPAVLALWERFARVCEYEALSNLPECQRPFSPFEPVDLSGSGGD